MVNCFQNQNFLIFNQNIVDEKKKLTFRFLHKANTQTEIEEIWVSEWLLFNTNSAIFQLYHGENKLIFNKGNTKRGVSPRLKIWHDDLWPWKSIGFQIKKQSRVTCLYVDCCFNELALSESSYACWSNTKLTSSTAYYPLANEVAKGYSNATVLP
jgi:hypothetical protein